MKKHHFATGKSLIMLSLLCAGVSMLWSCAEDGYDDETFRSTVTNSTLTSPAADGIVITPSADGKTQTISWKVVDGAGGYLVSLYDQGNMEEALVKDSVIDGCSMAVSREEDMNYLLRIQTLGNTRYNNAEASEVTEKPFSTFTPTYQTIPAGTDLAEYFKSHALPADSIGKNLNFDLEGGAEYTVSDVVDFDANTVTLRSTSKVNHAKIRYTGDKASLNFSAGFSVKYIDFDCAGSSAGVFAFSKESTVAPDETGFVLIKEPVSILNCNFDNVNKYFFWDQQSKTAVITFLVDNCVVRLTPPEAISGGVFWTNKAGHINDLTITNSTFYESPDNPGDIKYFYQAGMYRAKDINLETNSVTYDHCTFYHVTWDNGQWGNYNGMQSKATSYWNLTNCIFYDCSPSGVARRFLHGRTGQPGTIMNNTYMRADGTFDDPGNYDTSGTDIKEDPQFKNPSAGDFTISGATQVNLKTGDPRWLP